MPMVLYTKQFADIQLNEKLRMLSGGESNNVKQLHHQFSSSTNNLLPPSRADQLTYLYLYFSYSDISVAFLLPTSSRAALRSHLSNGKFPPVCVSLPVLVIVRAMLRGRCESRVFECRVHGNEFHESIRHLPRGYF